MEFSDFLTLAEERDINFRNITPEYIYKSYYDKVEWALPMISHSMSLEKPASKKQLCIVLGISVVSFKIMEDLFDELKEALNEKSTYMELKSELDLQRAIHLQPTNAKTLDMQLRIYKEGYAKNDKVEINMPKVEINYVDAGIDEVDFERFDKEFERDSDE